jgi:Rieske Fe-S protein
MSTVNQPQTQKTPLPSRREFLYYAGGATAALFATGLCGAIYNLAQVPVEIPKDGPAMFELDPNLLNAQTAPIRLSDARAWLLPTELGLIALSAVCPNEGCLLKWVGVNNRFECPCRGDKFQLDGTWIEEMARRDMDRLTIWVQTPSGILKTPPDGSPVPIHNATEIWIDRSRIIRGKPRI